MIGYILEKFVDSLDGLAMIFFIVFVVFPVLFVGFFTSFVYAAQAVSYYLIIKNKTYLKWGWSLTHADIIEKDGILELRWVTDKRTCTRRFHGFTYDDTIPILYRTKKTKRFIRCDEKYWRSRVRTRCIVTILWGIMFFPLFIKLWL